MNLEYDHRRYFMMKELNKIKGILCIKPKEKGLFVSLPTSRIQVELQSSFMMNY